MSIYKSSSLAMIPTAYKDGKLYSVRPNDGAGDFTFSRGSNLAATRVDVNGLIEKGRENILLQSNQFDTTWPLTRITLTSGQSGYDGSNNAWELSSTATSGQSSNILQNVSLSGVQTFSLYAKAGTASWFRILGDAATDYIAFFDLSGSGAVGTTSGEIDAQIVSVGGGWFRCSITANATISRVILNMAAGDNNVFPNTGDTIYIQDAQLEQGLVATDYIETGASTAQAGILEDMPRLDYSGSCPALLLEPQRTNRFAHSEYSGGFSSGSAITITDNATTSPEGLQNAIKITKSANGYAYFRGSIPADTGTLSVFAKKGNYRYIGLRNNQVAGNDHSVFDFDTETFVNVASGQTCTFEDYGDGWYRLSAYQPTNESSGYVGIALSDENGAELVGSSIADGSHFYIYGLQLESASYPTSYIPTYGSSVTRSGDSCLATSVSDLIGQTQGTLFAEIDFQQTESSSRFIAVGDGTSANRMAIFTNSSNDGFRVFVADNSNIQVDSSIAVSKGIVKLALAYANNDYVLYVNGVSRITDTNASVPACDNVYLGRQEISLTNVLGSGIKQAALFKTRLTNDELASLTTL